MKPCTFNTLNPHVVFRFFVSNRNRNSYCMVRKEQRAAYLPCPHPACGYLPGAQRSGPQDAAEFEASFPCCISLQAQMGRLGWCRTPVQFFSSSSLLGGGASPLLLRVLQMKHRDAASAHEWLADGCCNRTSVTAPTKMKASSYHRSAQTAPIRVSLTDSQQLYNHEAEG